MVIMLAAIMGISMFVGYWHGRKDGKKAMAKAVIRAINQTPIHHPSRSEGAD